MKQNQLKAPSKKNRTILLVRCSSDRQVQDSIPRQLELLRKHCKENGLINIAEMELKGVSASDRRYLEEFTPLLERARRREFDVLLFQSYDRFSRLGPEDGNALIGEFERNGVQLVSVLDPVTCDEDSRWYAVGTKLSDGRTGARHIARNSAIGRMRHLIQGRLTHTRCVPYAVDRLILNSDGVEMFVIRNLPDRRQAKLHPQTGDVLLHFDSHLDRRLAYRRQSNEVLTFTPGDPSHVDIVKLIYRRHYVDGWGRFKIAAELNQANIPSPNGCVWNLSPIDGILRNPVYLGFGICNQEAWGLFFIQNESEPIKTPKDAGASKSRAWMIRPEKDWLRVPYPRLADMLGFDLGTKESILKQQLSRMRERATGKQLTTRIGDTRPETPFFLRNVIRFQPGTVRAYGHNCGRSKKQGSWDRKVFRYYVSPSTKTTPNSGSVMRIDADCLEAAVLDLFTRCLGDSSHLQAIVRRHVVESLKEAPSVDKLRRDRAKEQQKLEHQLLQLSDQNLFGPHSMDLLKEKARRIENRLATIADELAGLPDLSIQLSEQQALKNLAARQRELLNIMAAKSPGSLRRVVNALVHKCDVNLNAESIELKLVLPSWALDKSEGRIWRFDLRMPICRSDHQHAKKP